MSTVFGSNITYPGVHFLLYILYFSLPSLFLFMYKLYKSDDWKIIQHSSVTSLYLQAGTPLTHALPQWFLLVKENYSVTHSSVLDSKSKTTWLKVSSSAACWENNMTLCWITPSLTFCFCGIPSLSMLASAGPYPSDQDDLKLRNLFASRVLRLRLYTTIPGSEFFFNSFSLVESFTGRDLVLKSPLPLFHFL